MSEQNAENAAQPVLRLLQQVAGLQGITIDDGNMRRLEWRAVRVVQAGARLRELDLESAEPAVTFAPVQGSFAPGREGEPVRAAGSEVSNERR